MIDVCGNDSVDVIRELSRLLDSSMVGPGERLDGQRAFQLLDPIRRFAAAHLIDPDDTLGRLHRSCPGVLAAADNRLGSQELLLRRLDSEQPNLQAVLTWVGRTGQPSGPLLRALGDVWVWMLARGYLRQTADVWRRIAALPESLLRTESDRLAAQWLTATGPQRRRLTCGRVRCWTRCCPHVRRLEPPVRIALVLSARAIVLPHDAHDRARATFEESLEVAREADDPLVSGYILSHYGLLLSIDGEPTAAQEQPPGGAGDRPRPGRREPSRRSPLRPGRRRPAPGASRRGAVAPGQPR